MEVSCGKSQAQIHLWLVYPKKLLITMSLVGINNNVKEEKLQKTQINHRHQKLRDLPNREKTLLHINPLLLES